MKSTYRQRYGHDRIKIAVKRRAQKEQKRIEAEQRNAAWQALTTVQKINELKYRPGNCGKQLARLMQF